MDTLATLLLVIIAAIPGPPAHRNTERAPQPAMEQVEKQASVARLSRQQNFDECHDAGKASAGPCGNGKMLKKRLAAQERIKTCNREASEKQLKGYARLDFVTACLHV